MDIGVVALGILTIVPDRWGGGRLDGDLGGRGDIDLGRIGRGIAIGVSIGIPIGPPVRAPVVPDIQSHPDASPAVPTMPAVPASPAVPTVEAMASPAMPTPTPRVPWDGTGTEQRDEEDKDPNPLLEFTAILRSVIHGMVSAPSSHAPCAGLLTLSGRQRLAQDILRRLARLPCRCGCSCIDCVLLYHPVEREINARILLANPPVPKSVCPTCLL